MNELRFVKRKFKRAGKSAKKKLRFKDTIGVFKLTIKE